MKGATDYMYECYCHLIIPLWYLLIFGVFGCEHNGHKCVTPPFIVILGLMTYDIHLMTYMVTDCNGKSENNFLCNTVETCFFSCNHGKETSMGWKSSFSILRLLKIELHIDDHILHCNIMFWILWFFMKAAYHGKLTWKYMKDVIILLIISGSGLLLV